MSPRSFVVTFKPGKEMEEARRQIDTDARGTGRPSGQGRRKAKTARPRAMPTASRPRPTDRRAPQEENAPRKTSQNLSTRRFDSRSLRVTTDLSLKARPFDGPCSFPHPGPLPLA